MKRMSFVLFIMIMLSLFVSGCAKVEPGYVGIKVNYYGSQKGVDDFPTITGINLYNPLTTNVFQYPTFIQTAVWTRNAHEGSRTNEEMSFSSKEGLIISSDVSLSYSLLPNKVPDFYVKFRSDDLNVFTHGFLRNVARDAFNETSVKFSVEELYGTSKEEFLTTVKARVNKEVAAYGVQLEQFGIIGAMRLPDSVTGAINAKIQATQDAMKAENELRQTQAEAAKSVAEAKGRADSQIAEAKGSAEALKIKAEAEAAYNQKIAQSITPGLLTKMYYDRWSGELPKMMLGNGSNTMLMVPDLKDADKTATK